MSIPVVEKFIVMKLDMDECRPYNHLSNREGVFDSQGEAEEAIKSHLSQLGGLMGPTPVLFVIKTFHGDN